MKKIFLLLLIVISCSTFAQVQIPQEFSINKPLQLQTVYQGAKSDSVLVRGADKIVKYVPRSEFGGSVTTSTINDVLATGNIATDKDLYLRNTGSSLLTYMNGGTIGLQYQGSPSDSIPTLELTPYNLIIRDFADSRNNVNVQRGKAEFSEFNGSYQHKFSINSIQKAGDTLDKETKLFFPDVSGDYRIGVTVNGEPADENGNFNVSAGTTQTLNKVLDAGNYANHGREINFTDPSGVGETGGTINYQGICYFDNPTNTVLTTNPTEGFAETRTIDSVVEKTVLSNDGLDFSKTGKGTVKIVPDWDTYTGTDNILKLPNKSGIAATTSDLPFVNPSNNPTSIVRRDRVAANFGAIPNDGGNIANRYITDLSFSTVAGSNNGGGSYGGVLVGVNLKARDLRAIAIGSDNSTENLQSTVIGSNNKVFGSSSHVIGTSNTMYSGSGGNIHGNGNTVYALDSEIFGTANVQNNFSAPSTSTSNILIGKSNTFTRTDINNTKAMAFGISNLVTGRSSSTFGQGLISRTPFETVVGQYNTDYTPVSTVNVTTASDRAFTIGVGTEAPFLRKDGLIIYRNDRIVAPNLTPALINSGGAKSLATKEYVDSAISSSASSQNITTLYHVAYRTNTGLVTSVGTNWTGSGTALTSGMVGNQVYVSGVGTAIIATVDQAAQTFTTLQPLLSNVTNSPFEIRSEAVKVSATGKVQILDKAGDEAFRADEDGTAVVGNTLYVLANGNIFSDGAYIGVNGGASMNNEGQVVGNNFRTGTVYTVATLPTPSSTDRVYASVSDALSPTYLGIVTGGGTVNCPVYWNGTNWITH